jgi:hypothetical protein
MSNEFVLCVEILIIPYSDTNRSPTHCWLLIIIAHYKKQSPTVAGLFQVRIIAGLVINYMKVFDRYLKYEHLLLLPGLNTAPDC